MWVPVNWYADWVEPKEAVLRRLLPPPAVPVTRASPFAGQFAARVAVVLRVLALVPLLLNVWRVWLMLRRVSELKSVPFKLRLRLVVFVLRLKRVYQPSHRNALVRLVWAWPLFWLVFYWLVPSLQLKRCRLLALLPLVVLLLLHSFPFKHVSHPPESNFHL